mmetsp:Transcript_77781/g.223353  ORF Transcript_77781/g.223353 Transcript_77781/m.223353 type:complete len:82 (+) Transcript_77781:304-549(+)
MGHISVSRIVVFERRYLVKAPPSFPPPAADDVVPAEAALKEEVEGEDGEAEDAEDDEEEPLPPASPSDSLGLFLFCRVREW